MDPIPYLSPDRARQVADGLVVLLVTLIALASALLVSDLSRNNLGRATTVPPLEPIAHPSGHGPVEPVRFSPATYEPIVERNLFGTRKPAEATEPGSSSIDPPGGALEESRLQVRLLGTVAGSPEDSLAIVQNRATKDVQVVRLGDLLAKGVHVIGIEARRILIDNRGRWEQIAMDLDFVDPPPPPRPPARPTPPEVDDHDGITRQGTSAFEIEREYLNRQLADLSKLLRDARVVPNSEQGRITGYTLLAIKPNSLYDRLGLQNGDVLRAINGTAIASPDKALLLLQDLRYESRFVVRVQRAGADLELDYTIR